MWQMLRVGTRVRLRQGIGAAPEGAVGVIIGRYDDRPDSVLVRFEAQARALVVPVDAIETRRETRSGDAAA
jgi:hypothetical protein